MSLVALGPFMSEDGWRGTSMCWGRRPSAVILYQKRKACWRDCNAVGVSLGTSGWYNSCGPWNSDFRWIILRQSLDVG